MSESSRPPVDPRATLHDPEESLPERALRVALEGRELGRESKAEVSALDDRTAALEQLVGRAPSALPGDRGSGLAQHLVDLTTAVGGLRESVDADRASRLAEALALAKRREPWGRVSWLAAGAAIAVAAGGGAQVVLHWLATLHH